MNLALNQLSRWLAATSLSHAIQTTGWIIPTLQTIHILCVSIVFASALLVDLRIFRMFERNVPLPEVMRRFLPTIWPGLVILLLTGSLLIIGEPRRSLINSTFQLKMVLLVIAVLLTVSLQLGIAFSSTFWERDRGRRIAGKLVATASILVWSGILLAGRWIAYTQAG